MSGSAGGEDQSWALGKILLVVQRGKGGRVSGKCKKTSQKPLAGGKKIQGTYQESYWKGAWRSE